MKKTVASAPGKIVLSGEYAVLDGAPAVCMAVDRRAYATVSESDADFSTVEAAAHTDTIGRFRVNDGVLQWLQGQKEFGVVDSVWRIAGVDDSSSHSIILDSSEFIDRESGAKTGIGSSAAITVALAAAVTGTCERSALMSIAQRAHADLQGGVGSGVDVACSIAGGLIEYRIEGASVAPLKWPAGLQARLVWTGVSASTRDKLSLLGATVSKPSRVRLVAAAENIALTWRGGNADQLIADYHGYIECLREFSIDHDLGIFDAGHADIQRVANADNLVYKPCGAGGGDVGIVFGTDTLRLDKFATQIAGKYKILDWRLTEVGATIKESKAEQ
jgi:phosphomevalonate kinase